MKKIIITSLALLFPAISYAATAPIVTVVNHVPSGTTSKRTVIRIPVGQSVTLAKAKPAAALLQEQDSNGNVTQSAVAVIKPLFVEHISTAPSEAGQSGKGAVVTVSYTFNYTLDAVKTNASGTQQATIQATKSYTNTVTKNVPYGQVETVNITLPPQQTAGSDATLRKLFPEGIFLTISANKQ